MINPGKNHLPGIFLFWQNNSRGELRSPAEICCNPRNAEDGAPYGRSAFFGFSCNHSNPQALCASSFAKGAYTVSHGFADKLIIIMKLSPWAP